MISMILRLLFWWWPKLPAWFRYGFGISVAIGAVVGWVVEPAAWPAWVLLMLVGGSAAMYGDESDAEKRGYRF